MRCLIAAVLVLTAFPKMPLAGGFVDAQGNSVPQILASNTQLESTQTKIIQRYFVEDVELKLQDQISLARANGLPPWMSDEATKKRRPSRKDWLVFSRDMHQLTSGDKLVVGQYEITTFENRFGGKVTTFETMTIVLPGGWDGSEIAVGGSGEESATVLWSKWGYETLSCFAFGTSGSITADHRMLPVKLDDKKGLIRYPNSELHYRTLAVKLLIDFQTDTDDANQASKYNGCRPFTKRQKSYFLWRDLTNLEWLR